MAPSNKQARIGHTAEEINGIAEFGIETRRHQRLAFSSYTKRLPELHPCQRPQRESNTGYPDSDEIPSVPCPVIHNERSEPQEKRQVDPSQQLLEPPHSRHSARPFRRTQSVVSRLEHTRPIRNIGVPSLVLRYNSFQHQASTPLQPTLPIGETSAKLRSNMDPDRRKAV